MEQNLSGPVNLYTTVPWQPFHLLIPPSAPDARSYEDLVKNMAELRESTTIKPAIGFQFVVRPYLEVIRDTAELREGSEAMSTPHFGRSSGRTIAAQGTWPPVTKEPFSPPTNMPHKDDKRCTMFSSTGNNRFEELIYTSSGPYDARYQKR
ncbi:hypothetical protein C0993_005490 [Termitomyces sp. T159_Od127]|nr:hypothetical protein C0993_005490 [Termitomyces sp. T159_Od127]